MMWSYFQRKIFNSEDQEKLYGRGGLSVGFKELDELELAKMKRKAFPAERTECTKAFIKLAVHRLL